MINSKNEKETLPPKTFPANGVIYVENSSSGCGIAKYTPFGSDTEHDTGCGNVYVHGEYTESLTIASADDVIVNGNLTTTSEEGATDGRRDTRADRAELRARLPPRQEGLHDEHQTGQRRTDAINGKCVNMKELGTEKSAGRPKSREITTTGLSTGNEVEGTVAGQIEAGTTISEVKAAENKLILNKPHETHGQRTQRETHLRRLKSRESRRPALANGDEVEGPVRTDRNRHDDHGNQSLRKQDQAEQSCENVARENAVGRSKTSRPKSQASRRAVSSSAKKSKRHRPVSSKPAPSSPKSNRPKTRSRSAKRPKNRKPSNSSSIGETAKLKFYSEKIK